MITELFYSRILNMNRGSLHTRILRHIHLFAFRYRLTNRLYAIEKFLGLSRNGPQTRARTSLFGVRHSYELANAPVNKQVPSEVSVTRVIRFKGLYRKELKREKCSTGVTEFQLVIIFRLQESGVLCSGSQQ